MMKKTRAPPEPPKSPPTATSKPVRAAISRRARKCNAIPIPPYAMVFHYFIKDGKSSLWGRGRPDAGRPRSAPVSQTGQLLQLIQVVLKHIQGGQHRLRGPQIDAGSPQQFQRIIA